MKKIIPMEAYNSFSRKIQVNGMLKLLGLWEVMYKMEIQTATEGLEKLVQLAPQFHQEFRNERHKIQRLQRSLSSFTE